MTKQESKVTKEPTNESPSDAPISPLPLKRQLRFAPLQLIGIPLLALFPLLAALGIFDDRTISVEASSQALKLQVEYSTLQRYKMQERMRATATLLSSAEPTSVTISFDGGYLRSFSDLTFAPSVTTLLTDTYVVELPALESGETRVVEIELKPEQYWRHSGYVSASTKAGESVTVPVNSFILP